MRTVVTLAVIALTLSALGGAALATGDGALLYGGAGQGKVIFDGRMHASKGLVCKDCHGDLFDTRKKALITMDDHAKAVACFACHDGKRQFNDCGGCHRKL
jgi:c(7)-type cytochrome triheme protein